MTRSLGGVGAWAEEAEREEAEREAQKILQQQQKQEAEAAAAVNVSKARRKKNPTYSISEVSTGQYVGHGGRSRALPEVRIYPFNDRNTLPERRAGAGSEQIERKREVVYASRADQVDDWSSGKKSSAAYSAGESKSDRRRFPSQDARVVEAPVPSSSQDECEQTEVADRQRQARVRSDPFAGARPREEVLAGKGKHKEWEGELDKVKEKETDGDGISAEDKVSGVVEEVVREEKSRVEERPSSSSSTSTSRPPIFRVPEDESQGIPQKKKVNPFGEARPREDLLLERGLDWRKIDLELQHRAVDRPESERERKLKEEIRMLENLVKNPKDGDCGTTIERTGQILDKEQVENIRAQLMQKESELQKFTLALDDMVRFPQKQVDRPSSQSGRSDHPDKMAVGSEQTDSSKAYNPGRLGTLPLSREITREYDYERLSSSSRDMDISQGIEAERHGGMIRGYDPSDFRGAGIDSPRSRSGSGDFPGGYDVNRPGVHSRLAGCATASDSGWADGNPGYNYFYQGNGSEREQFNSGHVNFRRGYIPERLGSRSQRNNIPQGYDIEKSSSGSWHSDEREYGPERSGPGAWHDDEFIYESERPRASSRQGDVQWNESAGRRPNSKGSDTVRGLPPERTVSLPARENLLRGGSDFERPGSFSGPNKTRKSVFERLGPLKRDVSRRYDSGMSGSRPEFVDAYREFNAMHRRFGKEDSERLHEVGNSSTAHEHERREPWPGQADIRRGYDTYRASEISNDQFVYKGGNHGEDFSGRRNRAQEYYRRGNYAFQDKFGQGRGIHRDHW